jgi:hypothetical protein
LISTSRVKKNVCGGVNVASDAPLPSPTSSRFCALTGANVLWTTPPNAYCCGRPPVSRQTTRGVRSVDRSFQARLVLVGDPLSFGRRERIHSQQVGAAIGGEPQIAGEDAIDNPGKRHLERGAIGSSRGTTRS